MFVFVLSRYLGPVVVVVEIMILSSLGCSHPFDKKCIKIYKSCCLCSTTSVFIYFLKSSLISNLNILLTIVLKPPLLPSGFWFSHVFISPHAGENCSSMISMVYRWSPVEDIFKCGTLHVVRKSVSRNIFYFYLY